MLVEEAGQVLEAHILGSLVPSIEHLIMIGDPFQLRPTINTYGTHTSLSPRKIRPRIYRWVSRRPFHGSQVGKKDIQIRHVPYGTSFFFWALYVSNWCATSHASGDFKSYSVSCTRITLMTGRSKAHTVSIRNTLYPKLQDHDLVKDHPNVRGIQKNVFFLSHNHKENGEDIDGLSKYNQYEACFYFSISVWKC